MGHPVRLSCPSRFAPTVDSLCNALSQSRCRMDFLLSDRMQDWLRDVPTKLRDFLAMGLFYAAGGSFLGGLGLLVYQALFWLKHGTWEPITVFVAIKEFLPARFMFWLVEPSDWIGMSKLVTYALFCSLWWVLILFAVPLIYCAVAVARNEKVT